MLSADAAFSSSSSKTADETWLAAELTEDEALLAAGGSTIDEALFEASATFAWPSPATALETEEAAFFAALDTEEAASVALSESPDWVPMTVSETAEAALSTDPVEEPTTLSDTTEAMLSAELEAWLAALCADWDA
jgi:hypothetical protein